MSPDAVVAHRGVEPLTDGGRHTQRPDVLEHLHLDHERLRTLLDRAGHAHVGERPAVTRTLVDAIVRHETAEAVLVRPRTRATSDGPAVARILDRQERTIGRLASTLAQTDPAEDEFPDVLQRLRAALLHHIAAEEHAEHPRLAAALGPAELEELGRRVLRVTSMELPDDGPTGSGPADAGGGGAGELFARTRELVRHALSA